MQYHFIHECVLSGEVELQYVPSDWQNADIFTKPLRMDKLRQFLGVLGSRLLDAPNLRGREGPNDHGRGRDDEFNFGSTEEYEGGSAEESESGHNGRQSQPSMGEMKPSRARRLNTSWR